MRMFRNRALSTLAVASAVLLLASGCAATAPAKPHAATTSAPTPTLDSSTAAALQKALDGTRTQAGSPGAIAEVTSPAGTWIGSSGTAAQGTDTPVTPDDRTRIGSLTKTMTATILLQLVEEHKLSLDDTIGKYVPGMPNGDTATLRQLADMTSGIPSYTASTAWQNAVFADPQKQWTPQSLVDFEKGQPADFAPGAGWAYSNTNYVLLGMVIEKVTGEPIATVFNKRIFEPLKMTHSSFPVGTNTIASPYLSGITEQGQPDGKTADATEFSPSIAFTAGQVISTLSDLEKWSDALFTGHGILTPAMQKLRRDSIIRNIPPNTAQAGYGLGIGDRNGWWGHDGEIPGYNTVLFHNYALDTTIIVIVNSDVPFGPADAQQSPAQAVFAALVKVLSKP
ncbi:serine hydrolase domain-containing protein [Rathayibacter soli]|uniref:serine hydrolase domain-containing protein n=1 Tax=Rathayibacter soli TaxID=3144168 RepID=UPI0027E44C89|nr:serine hydrolase domain-containing protein [Glaciibacter superstes]